MSLLGNKGILGFPNASPPPQILYSTLAAHWSQSRTFSNIGTAFVDVYNQTNSNGKSIFIDLANRTQVQLCVNWNRIGSGTQTVQVINVANSTVLISLNVVSGFNDTGLVAIPAALLDTTGRYKLQAKSTTSTDDPVFEGAAILIK